MRDILIKLRMSIYVIYVIFPGICTVTVAVVVRQAGSVHSGTRAMPAPLDSNRGQLMLPAIALPLL